MICVQCMQDKPQKEWSVVYSYSNNPDITQGDYCICLMCLGIQIEYPSLKSIN